MKSALLFTLLIFKSLLCLISAQNWQGDLNHFNISSSAIQLNAPEATASSYISQESDIIEQATWEFSLTLDFNPSSSNYAHVFLSSNSANLKADLNGYYVLVGGTKDEVSLIKKSGESSETIIDGTDKRIDLPKVDIRIRVTRSGNGNWVLSSKLDSENAFTEEGRAFDNTYITSAYRGFICNYTKTRSTKFSFSPFTVSGKAFTDTVAPRIDSLRAITRNSIKIWFSEEVNFSMDKIQSILPQNTVDSIANNNAVYTVFFNDDFEESAETKIVLNELQDIAGNNLASKMYSFSYDAFTILEIVPITNKSLYLKLSKNALLDGSETVQYNEISSKSVEYFKEKNTLLITFDGTFPEDTVVNCDCSTIKEKYGDPIKDTNPEIIWHTAKASDLLLSEIMADPEPRVFLPNVEYIEIYNTTGYPISLYEIELHVKTKQVVLNAPRQIQPNTFVTLISDKYVEQISESLGVKNFPTLTNSRFKVWLSNNSNTLDYMEYSDSLYTNDAKKAGGWSMERIDLTNYANKYNWNESRNKNGGTPGQANSVEAINSDTEIPYAIHIYPESNTSIVIQFSERVKWANTSSDQIQLNDKLPVVKNLASPKQDRIYLSFTDILQQNTNYTLTLGGLSDFNDNLLADTIFQIALPKPIEKGSIVFNEIMPNPKEDSPEYVEITNISSNYLDLSKLYIAKIKEGNLLSEAIQLSEVKHLIAPNEYIVITPDANKLLYSHPQASKYFVLQVNKMPPLSNEADKLALVDLSLTIIDEVHYTSDWHHPFIKNEKGVALEKRSPELESNFASNWSSASSTTNFSSPTAINSLVTGKNVAESKISLSEESISPDNDGIQDYSEIMIPNTYIDYLCTAKVYSYNGILQTTICTNQLIGNWNQINWNGFDENAKRCPIGVYVIQIELVHPSGSTEIVRLPISVSARF